MSADEGRSHTREAIVLALASPMIAELLSSSAPPLQFFTYWVFALFVMFYGCAAVLIREVTVRWGSGWRGVLLLGAAFGILDEGPAARAFFNPASPSLGQLTGRGFWLGVNWIWSVDAVLYHATFSAALPILLVSVAFPQSRRQRWLRWRGLIAVAVLFGLGAAVFVGAQPKYPAPASYLTTCYALIAVLIFLASRASKPAAPRLRPRWRSPWRFVAIGFLATTALLLHIFVVPALVGSPALIVAILIGVVVSTSRLLVSWTGGGEWWTDEQQCGLVVGAVGCLGILAFIHELNPSRTYDATGMAVVGAATLAGLAWLWRRVGRTARAAQGTPVAG